LCNFGAFLAAINPLPGTLLPLIINGTGAGMSAHQWVNRFVDILIVDIL
jgi:hypothetical protein